MKAQDLRIGNYVVVMHNVQKVTQILEKGLNCGNVGCLYSLVEPIPLTEEWLVKFGFDTYDSEIDYIEWGKPYNGNYQKSFSGNEWFDSDGVDDNGDLFRITSDGFYSRNELYFSYQLGDFYVRRKVKYVHQLQNLYFALTGEELTIKEPA